MVETIQDQPCLHQLAVVMVPFPAQSHLNQLLRLSHIISSYHIPVHYIGLSTQIKQVKSRSSMHHDQNSSDIQFHEFDMPSLASPPPDPDARTKFPEHLIPLFAATKQQRDPVFSLLRSLSPLAKRVVIIHDSLMAYAVQDFASLPNVEAYSFIGVSAFGALVLLSRAFGRKVIPIGDHEGALQIDELPSPESCMPPLIIELIALHAQATISQSGELYNTCRTMESSFLELLAERGGMKWGNKIWAIGPLLDMTSTVKRRDHKCLEWLDRQEQNSVLYVSFGTTTTLRDDEIKEIAVGLEESGTKFIWVLRDSDKADALGTDDDNDVLPRPQLPLGFEERMEGMGMVVRDWAPQLEILEHSSTGGFVSHCGWNSCVESITNGVPIAAWPMHSEQPSNAVLITEVLKVGLAVIKWEQRDELVSASVISDVVKRLMNSDEGDEIRKRTEEIGVELNKSTGEAGVTRLEWESFIAHISR